MKLLPIFLSSAILLGLAVVSIGCGGESVSVESTLSQRRAADSVTA
jgi:hypothetical protein